MMVEGYPNLKEEVGGLNPGCDSPLYLTKNLSGGQLPPVLGIGLSAFCLKKKTA